MKNYKSDLKERCYKFSLAVISLLDTLPNKRSAWAIADQLVRAATSVGANLVEAGASSSRLEYKKFYEISLKSANETKYWLRMLSRANSELKDSTRSLWQEAKELTLIFSKITSTLNSKK